MVIEMYILNEREIKKEITKTLQEPFNSLFINQIVSKEQKFQALLWVYITAFKNECLTDEYLNAFYSILTQEYGLLTDDNVQVLSMAVIIMQESHAFEQIGMSLVI
ncbi:hypothetical protein CN286_27495 [Bacillus anthracis]|nr:hypothetical protein CN286_27495 [Bacillus anthracis]